MPVTDITDTVQEQIIDGLKFVQDAVVDAVRQTAETLEGFVPDLSFLPFADLVPDPAKAADDAIRFAGKVYDLQKDFALSIVDAARPLVGATADRAEA